MINTTGFSPFKVYSTGILAYFIANKMREARMPNTTYEFVKITEKISEIAKIKLILGTVW